MPDFSRFFIDGAWVAPTVARPWPVHDPATTETLATVSLGGPADVNRAVAAARAAFADYAALPPAERAALLRRAAELYKSRYDEIAATLSAELGAPLEFARRSQAALGIGHLRTAAAVAERCAWRERREGFTVVREPIGVCALITPWNWPINQVACKVAPALAAGCTVVLKPSELAPLCAMLFAEVLAAAGFPPGVFNLVNGDGPGVGQALAAHPDVDMVSFTGSTRAGIAVAQAAAATVKRVHQELGGKSANLVLDAGVLERGVVFGVTECFQNSGQSCNAPSRLLVPAPLQERAVEIARGAAEALVTGDPTDPRTQLGPLISERQYERVQRFIQAGIDAGARRVCGGPGRPDGLERGWYARPTVFADVTPEMAIARDEIFGPVLAIMPCADTDDAVRIANDTPYGLAAYAWASDPAVLARVADRLRAGMVHLNGAPMTLEAPFGGYRQSGNGREWGEFGLAEYLEIKAILGGADG